MKREQYDALKKDFDAAKADYKIIEYPGAVHAFTNPEATELGKKFNLPLRYDAKVDEDAKAEATKFFAAEPSKISDGVRFGPSEGMKATAFNFKGPAHFCVLPNSRRRETRSTRLAVEYECPGWPISIRVRNPGRSDSPLVLVVDAPMHSPEPSINW